MTNTLNQIRLQIDQNRNFQKFMENQFKQKKQVTKGKDDNKQYIEFLKQCEIDTSIQACLSPTPSEMKQNTRTNSKNINQLFESNNNVYNGEIKQNNLQSSLIMKDQFQFINQTPYSASPGINTLFDFLLKKHNQLYSEIMKSKGSTNNIANKKSLILTQSKIESKKLKFNSSNNVQENACYSRRNTSQGGSNYQINNLTDENNVTNILQKEETLKIIFKNPSNLTVVRFKVKIVPLLMQEPLLAISIQDITQSEEEKKQKRIEQENNLINLQVISKIKSHLEYLYKYIYKIKNIRMKQSIVFPLNIIRSTAQIEKNRINFEPFLLNTLLKEIAKSFNNVVQIKVKQNVQSTQSYISKIASARKNEGQYFLESMNEYQGESNSNENENENEISKDLDNIDLEQLEEQELDESVKQQKETIINKYNLASIISSHREILSFPTQNILKNKEINSQNNIQQQDMLRNNKSQINKTKSEFSIVLCQANQKQTISPVGLAIRDERIHSCLDMGQEQSKTKMSKYGNKIPIRYENKQNSIIDINQSSPKKVSRKNWMIKSISNDSLVDRSSTFISNQSIARQNIAKRKEQNTQGILIKPNSISPSYQINSQNNFQVQTESLIQATTNFKQKLVSQIKSKLKQLDIGDQTPQNVRDNTSLADKHRLTITDEFQRRGQSIFSTTGVNYPPTSGNIPSTIGNIPSTTGISNIPSTARITNISSNQNQTSILHQKQIHHEIDESENYLQDYSYQANTQKRSPHYQISQQNSSTHIETEVNEIASEREIKLNNILNNPKKQMNNEIKILSNYRLIFQALCGIITSFGQQNLQIVIETINKKLYNSIKFTIQPSSNKSPPNTNISQITQVTATPVFNFESSPQEYQFQMFPDLNIPLNNVNSPSNYTNTPLHQLNSPQNNLNTPLNLLSNQFNHLYSQSPTSRHRSQQNEKLDSPNKQYSKQNTKTTKFDNSQAQKKMTKEEDFKKNLYDLNKNTNKQLANRIWKSIKEIASTIGPDNIECSENCISIEFFINMNVIKDEKFINQDINHTNQYNKLKRNSLYNTQLQQISPYNNQVANQNYITSKDSNNNSLIHQNEQNININNNSILFHLQDKNQFDIPSVTNKNSFHNLQAFNSNQSFNNYVQNPFFTSKKNLTTTSGSAQQLIPNYQSNNTQPFMINSKLRIPEEEETNDKKKQFSVTSLSLQSIQSQQDEGVKEVQPVKSFLNQNANFKKI